MSCYTLAGPLTCLIWPQNNTQGVVTKAAEALKLEQQGLQMINGAELPTLCRINMTRQKYLLESETINASIYMVMVLILIFCGEDFCFAMCTWSGSVVKYGTMHLYLS